MRRLTQVLSLLFALSLLASACGNSDETDDTATEGAGGAVDDQAVEDAIAGSDDDEMTDDEPVEATSIEELEAQWAATRAGIVETLNSDEYGVGDDNILRGPGGFEVDLNSCPADWSDTGGVDGDTIKVGQTIAQSGNLASYGNLAVGMEVYFDYVNANGGIDGKQIELIVKDDAYVATQTIELVDELLQSEDPFYITTLGSPNTLAVYDTMNRRCVPQPFVETGHPAWGDPENHPWTTGLQMSYSTEAILWGNWIKENLSADLPVSVGGLVMDNDFGLAYREAFQDWADANPDVIAEFNPVPHDPAAPTVTNEMTTIAAGEPDVFVAMTAGNPCLLAIQEAGNSGLTESAKALFTSSVCKDPNAYMIPAGDSADGFLIVGGGIKATTDPQYADDVYVQFVNAQLEAAGRDPMIGYFGAGFSQYGWAHIEAMRIAAELDGGLTRTNLMLAIHALDLDHPILIDGISFSVNGIEDAYLIEGSEFSSYDAAGESWVQMGNAIDLNGSSPTCAWGPDGC